MTRIFRISVLILLYLLVTSKSCDNQEQDDEARDLARIKLARDSIKSTFESDTLSDISLRAFESAAIIKLSDFSDYLTLLQDASKATPFRDKAREMIRGFFISENSGLRFSGPDGTGRREIPVKQILQDGDNGSAPFGGIITDSIKVQQPLRRADDLIYAGKLSFSYIPDKPEPAKRNDRASANGTIDFLVMHHIKKFGQDTLMIWEVFLGNNE